MTGLDYYRTLGVPPSATGRAIREAYLDLVRRLHPDRVGPNGTAIFQEITEAYENLSDPKKRGAYDRRCSRPVAQSAERREEVGFVGAIEPLIPEPDPVSNIRASSSATMEETLGWLERNSPTTSNALELQVILSREEVLRGVELSLVVPFRGVCSWCRGWGGKAVPCLLCGGSGAMTREQVIRLRIPPHVGDGTVMEVPLDMNRQSGWLLRMHISVQRQASFW